MSQRLFFIGHPVEPFGTLRTYPVRRVKRSVSTDWLIRLSFQTQQLRMSQRLFFISHPVEPFGTLRTARSK